MTSTESARRYRLGDVARMEWVKLRSLRSTWSVLAVTVIATVGIGAAVGGNTADGRTDLTNNALAGVVPGLLLAGALGVLTMTGEYTSGTIRATLAAVPRRRYVVAAKAFVFGGVTLLVGEFAAFAAFLAADATTGAGVTAPSLRQGEALRAVLMTGVGCCLIGLLGLGLGAMVRHSATAVGVLVAAVYVAPQAVGIAVHGAAPYMPILIVENSLSTTKPVTCGGESCPDFLPAWAGLGMLALYASVAMTLGGFLLARRDG